MKGKHIGGILILVVGIGIWGYSTFSTYAPKEYLVSATGEKATSTMNTTTGETTPGAKSFILADIATHKDSISCY